jgi:hypothetical protein
VEETGKTGFAHLLDLATPRDLAQVNPGDAVELVPDGPRLKAISTGVEIGVVEPRVAARLLKLIAEGNKYQAGVTSLGDKNVRIIIRETYCTRNTARCRSPRPPASRTSALHQGTLVREEWSSRRAGADEDDDRGHRLRPACDHPRRAFGLRATTTSTTTDRRPTITEKPCAAGRTPRLPDGGPLRP